ncbi:MAG: ABC transporter substrate-binding protein [Bernardetiaceae bacterium]|nr:ABC transporter substrate-binding protein [Bernardetiaceae bacterium]
MMRIFYMILMLLFFCVQNATQAQKPEDFDKQFKAAKALLDAGNFEKAQMAFSPIARKHEANAYTTYAHYFQALAAYKAGNKNFAQSVLNRLIDDYSGWENIEEAYYLRAAIELEQKRLESAMKDLKQIKNPKILKASENLKWKYLPEFSTEILKKTYKAAPKDKVLAQVLALRLEGSTNPEEQKIREQILEKFPDKNLASTSNLSKTQNPQLLKKKETYAVALILPFMDGEQGYSLRDMQFIWDLYAGIKVAQETLEAEDKKIKLLVYDSKRSPSTIRRILEHEDFKNVDLIIGGIYPEELTPLANYAEKQHIPLLNPLTSNPDFIANSKQTYLLHPSLRTQAKQIAAYTYSQMKRPKSYIIYGDSKRDSVFAHLYQQELRLKGSREVEIKQIVSDRNTFRNVQNFLSKVAPKASRSVSQTEKNELIQSDTTAHVVAFTSDQALAASIVSVITSSQSDIPLFVEKEWLNFSQISYDIFEKKEIYILYPDYFVQNEHNEEFTKKFIEKMQIMPSDFAYIGYEALHFFGNMLVAYGENFTTYMREKVAQEGAFTPLLDYNNAFDNQFVPIFRIQKGQLKIINYELEDGKKDKKE